MKSGRERQESKKKAKNRVWDP